MKRKTLLLLALVVSPITNALASLTADSIHLLEDVVVRERVLRREVLPVQTLSGVQLQRLSSVSVADALRYFAGVQIKDYGGVGGLKTVNVRGMGSQHVGVFYDGIQLGNAQNGQIDLGRFSLDNMEAVSIYNGQKSALLQPARHYASASALYLTARRPALDFAGDHRLKTSLRLGSFSTINPSVLWEHQLSSRLSYSLSGEYLYTSGRYRFRYKKRDGYDTVSIRHNGDVRALRLEGGLWGKLQHGSWKGKLYFYDSERGYPGAAVREVPGAFRHEDRQWDRNFFAQASLQESRGIYSYLVQAKYANNYLHYLSDPRKDVSTMYVDNHYRQQEGYVSLAQTVGLSSALQLGLSTDLQYNTLDADLYDFAYPERWSFLSALSATYTHDELRIQGSLLHTALRDQVKEGEPAPAKRVFTPSLVLSYRPGGGDLQLRGFYKRIFRMPTFNDLYYTFIGTKSLRPEYTTQYDLGLTWGKGRTHGYLRRWEVQVDGYYNEVTDKIVAVPTSNQFRWTMLNLGKVRIVGVDLNSQLDFQAGAFTGALRLAYTFQRAQDVTDKGSAYYGGQIPYIPQHSFSIIQSLGWRGWELLYSFIYTGERYDASANIRENYVRPWYTHDLSLTRTFALGHQTLRGTLEVNNLLNQQYEVVRSYPMPGTNVRLRFDWTL